MVLHEDTSKLKIQERKRRMSSTPAAHLFLLTLLWEREGEESRRAGFIPLLLLCNTTPHPPPPECLIFSFPATKIRLRL